MRSPLKYVKKSNIDVLFHSYQKNMATGNFLPAVYVLEPTNRCSLFCKMCPNSRLSKSLLGEMEISEFKRILRIISPYAEHVMLYFMGETFLHSNFTELIYIARKELNGIITLSTNCMLLSGDKAEAALKAPIDLLICCIDHWNERDYSKIRVGGDFKTVVNNTKEILRQRGTSEKPIVIVKSLDFGMEAKERDDFIKYWKSLGAIPIIGWVDSWAGQFPELLADSVQPQPYEMIDRKPCADLWFKMVINSRSEVVLCCHNYDYSIKFGDLNDRNKSLFSIWHDSTLINYRQAHVKNLFSCNILCEKCSEWGKIDELDVYCSLDLKGLPLIF